MSEEPRRSGRSTKGHHSSTKASSSPAPTQQKAAKPAKTKSKKAAKAATEDEADSEEGDIRCICGDTNPKTNLEFIGCEACLCWQHNVCMGEPESEDGKLPEHYFCEECRPEEHRETVSALKEGKKIWETRQQLFKQWKKMSSSRKRSKAKSGEELRPTYVKKDEDVETVGTDTNGGQETGTKRKRQSVIPDDDEDAEARTSAPVRQRRKPSALDDPDTAVVAMDQLPTDRRKIAQALSAIISADINDRVKPGYRIPDGHTAGSLGERYATLLEYALYQNHGGPAEERYKAQFRALNANLKRNKVLIERLLEDSLTADELAVMESKDMASEEQQLERKRMKEELDRQAVAIQEEGPRFKQDHKGVEKIEDDRIGASEFATNAQPVRERASIAEESVNESPGGGADAVATPRQPPQSALDRRSSSQQNFDMNNIWQKTTVSAQSPTSSTGPRLLQMPPRRRSSVQNLAQQNSPGVPTEDPDVDRLLQDDDDSYEPSDLPDNVIWRGKLVHAGEGEPVVNARFVAGRDIPATTAPWRQILPPKLTIDGRLAIAKAEEYLCGLQWSHTSDVSVLALRPYDDKDAFDRVFDYFASRQRYAVINRDKPALVKDLYVIPVEKGAQLPEHVTLLEHSELKAPAEERMMLATFVIARAQQQAPGLSTTSVNGGQASELPSQQQQQQPPYIPQHIRAGAPGPAGSPLNQNNPSFSPSGLTQPGQQPTAGYGAPIAPPAQPPFSGNGFPPNPYNQPPLPAPPPGYTVPMTGIPVQYPPMVVEILGPRFMDASAQAVLAAQPNLEEAKVRHLRAILDEDVDARTNVEALARRIGAIGS